MSENIEIRSSAELGAPIVIQVSEYEGDMRMDVRHNYKVKDTDEIRPTRKGVNMPLSESLTFIHDLVDAYNQATDAGLELS